MTNPTSEIAHLKRLPLHSEHERLGARFGAFGDWCVPLYYTSVIEEHETVRTGVGVFDISHMGEFFVRGRGARPLVNRWLTNDVAKLSPGRALYSPVCREDGGIIDDVVMFEEHPEQYLIVVNAANIEKDFAWFQGHSAGDVSLENASARMALLAVQGPRSRQLIGAVFDVDLTEISYYHFVKFSSPFGEILLSETGYTGEEGFEVFCLVDQVSRLWRRLMETGNPMGLKPIGFGARDTLRLEARLLLYGHDMTDETTPLEAGLGWVVGWTKDDFIGKRALEAERARGSERKLIGFELDGRGIARPGCRLSLDRRPIGNVTSGTYSPTLRRSIGLAYIATEYADIGRTIDIEIRGKSAKARIVKTPFYKRTSSSLGKEAS